MVIQSNKWAILAYDYQGISFEAMNDGSDLWQVFDCFGTIATGSHAQCSHFCLVLKMIAEGRHLCDLTAYIADSLIPAIYCADSKSSFLESDRLIYQLVSNLYYCFALLSAGNPHSCKEAIQAMRLSREYFGHTLGDLIVPVQEACNFDKVFELTGLSREELIYSSNEFQSALEGIESLLKRTQESGAIYQNKACEHFEEMVICDACMEDHYLEGGSFWNFHSENSRPSRKWSDGHWYCTEHEPIGYPACGCDRSSTKTKKIQKQKV
ncbi:MAG: hypothetical protein ACP5OG_02980 [Candidatus Nanoarchaeia archaeon]